MAVSDFLSAVQSILSKEAKVLADPTTEDFKQALSRWSIKNLKTPGAIVLVATEKDIIESIRLAVKHNIPFVPKSGGHSLYSTIGLEGIIIDLSAYNAVTVDKANKTVTIQSGVLNQQLIAALYENELYLPLGGGNTIGSVPQALGGGLTGLSKPLGNTSSQILSARFITATGTLLTIDASTPDLLYALKGAGQHFGLTTSLTLQAYPLSVMRSEDGTLWHGTFVFPLSSTAAVVAAAAGMMDEQGHNSANIVVVTLDPGSGTPCLLVMCVFFGSSNDAEIYTAPYRSLNPMMAIGERISYANINDGMDAFMTKGDYKQFRMAGTTRFDPEPWAEIVEQFVQLKEKCPDVVSGGFGFEWATGKQKEGEMESAWAHADVKCWVQSLSWHTNPASISEVDAAAQKMIETATRSFEPEELHAYQNFTRESTLESRFGSRERIEKLQALKRKWDPTGVFTKTFL